MKFYSNCYLLYLPESIILNRIDNHIFFTSITILSHKIPTSLGVINPSPTEDFVTCCVPFPSMIFFLFYGI